MSINSFDIVIKKHGKLLVDVKNFHYADNKITFLFGESGIGKSLISKAIYGILDPNEFYITINNRPYQEYCKSKYPLEIQKNSFFVFQEPSTHLNPLMKLSEQINENNFAGEAISNKVLQKLWDSDDNSIQTEILDIYPKPYRPSGGEKQRLLLAMSFIKIEKLKKILHDDRSFYVFDEPSGSLDNYYRDIFLSYLFGEYEKRKFTILLITHDYSIISATQKYGANIFENIDYKELALEKNRLTLRDFNPKKYLDWIEEKKLRKDTSVPIKRYKDLLQIESGIEVINKRMYISKGAEFSQHESLKIYPSSLIYLKAPSGTGKTTLAKSIMGLIDVKKLRMKIKNIEITEKTPKIFWKRKIWGKQIALTFQHADEAINQDSTVGETLSGLNTKISNNEIKRLMNELFDLNIDDIFLRKKVKYLSGGQKQKLNLIRSFVLDTDILILDEPLNGLDFDSILKVLKMIEKKQKEGKGILLISHNEEIFDAVVTSGDVYYLRSESV